MPTYDYLCGACGPFSLHRPISEYAQGQECPDCQAVSPRILVNAPALGGAAERLGSEARRNRSILGQRLSGLGHGAGCACCRK